jgi:hypothetical protein
MKIALLGGTGDIGEGLALRWASNHEIIIGSRKEQKAKDAVARYEKILQKFRISCNMSGRENAEAAQEADVVVLSIPYKHIVATIKQIRFSDQIVITPAVPMKKVKNCMIYCPPKEGSCALLVQKALPRSAKLVAAYQSVAAEKLADVSKPAEGDVIICSDDDHAKKVVMQLTADIKNLRPLDGGPLAASAMVEALVPLLINVELKNKVRHPTIRIL